MAIDGATRLMGVIGENIAYTRSPAMHNRAASLLGVNVAYLPLSMPTDKIAGFLDAAWALDAVGFNVTTPHKAHVASLFAPAGGGLASVNTLYRGAAGWAVASTDGEGFARGLGRLGRDIPSFRRVVLLGAGGAASAVLAYLAGAATAGTEVTVLHRGAADPGLAALAGKLSLTQGAMTPAALATALKGRGAETLVVQATSAPQRGADLAEFLPALDGFSGVFVDLVYGKPSALYFGAVARDLVTQDGEAMLIEQARLAQQLWWGKAASYEVMAQALRGK